MSKKEKSMLGTRISPIVITLIILIPVLFLFMVFVMWWLDTVMLEQSISFIDSFTNHFQEVVVLSICFWALAFYYVQGSTLLRKPKDTDTLASEEWQSIAKQKQKLALAPLDTSQLLQVGGAPINKISSSEILYEAMAMHDLTMGVTRSGKSRKIVRQLVMLASMARESMIFNDPKKEMYQDFKIYLESKGYDVYCLDFRKPEVSNAWNPLDDITYMFNLGRTDDADQYADDQVTSLVVDNGKSEPIWIDGQKALIKSLILEVTNAKIPSEKKNYYSILQMMSILGKEEKVDGKNQMLLSVYMNSLDEMSPSRVSYTPIATSPDKTRGSFMTSALATLHPFAGQKLMKVLSHSDFNFHDFTEGKKALFVVNPDEKHTYDAITAMVYDNAYQSLIFEANKLPGRKLKKRVHMIYDEFGNMPKISHLDGKLTVSLSREILYHLYLQDFKQMNEKYGDNVASIIRGNCNLWYFISSADFDTCEEMSKKIGSKTIWVANQGGNFNSNSSTTGGSVGYNQQAKRLIDANQLMSSDMTDGHDIIVYRQYLGPCKVELPDASAYPWYKEMIHDETETLNEGLKLDYAIPRYIVINREMLSRIGFESAEMPMMGSMQAGILQSSDMYWYWAKRNDLGPIVTQKVLTHLNRTKSIRRADIKDYLESDEFIQWLWNIDKEKDGSEKEVNRVDQIVKNIKAENIGDTAFADNFLS